ncbi:hypothetical protein HD600_001917 [Microbacterium ginsengiterrae]|uniref:Alternate signal-mediated exported protein n=1 Tax=Microbacterium ginsengiterrae TaxID=546115 RepID=A0A7W9CD64_9MICO|nr:hypothetical protein [Microbacterium ginsengiterrae]MBB5743420.1 hypothetical protein [Microbacterium ginsengiterrae]
MRTTLVRRAIAATAAVAASIAIVGCGPAPWSDGPEASKSPSPTVAPPAPNDLSGGATERELTAGAVTAQVDYWSTLSMDRWTADAVKPVSISLVTTVTPDDGQKVYLQKASMLAVPANATETFAPLEAQVDAASVAPGYLVLSPYSYSQTFNVGPVDPAATHVTIQFTYDFLVQTTPTSSEYAKQTATDTLTVAIAQPADAE